jgi:hypothetical protein
MRSQPNLREMAALIVFGAISLTALVLVAIGTPVTAVKDILTIVLPPLVVIAAYGERRGRPSS